MYKVTLINLTADARAVSPLAHGELGEVAPGAMEGLLRNFCAIDPIENAVADTEIRVQVRHEKYLLRTEQKKLILYDASRREAPAQIMTVEEVLRELDGSATLARQQSLLQAREEAGAMAEPEPLLPVTAPPKARPALVAGLLVTAGLLLAVILWLHAPGAGDGPPPDFIPVGPGEIEQVQAGLVGVYLTGTGPGQHGIAVLGPGEMKLFELAAVEAPRVVYAGYRPGRISGRLSLATDQPGGVIEVTAEGHLVYGGETYLRIP